jgi:hypothetical protein
MFGWLADGPSAQAGLKLHDALLLLNDVPVCRPVGTDVLDTVIALLTSETETTVVFTVVGHVPSALIGAYHRFLGVRHHKRCLEQKLADRLARLDELDAVEETILSSMAKADGDEDSDTERLAGARRAFQQGHGPAPPPAPTAGRNFEEDSDNEEGDDAGEERASPQASQDKQKQVGVTLPAGF